MKKNNIVVLIPSLNPKEDFYDYAKELTKQNNVHLIVIDDGSREEYKNIFQKIEKLPNTIVLTHRINQGKGRGIKTGLDYYLKNFNQEEYPGIVTADSDGQHTIKDVLEIGTELNNSKEELILGIRDFNQDNVPFKSRNGNKITSFLFKLLYGKKIHDTQTGLRGISYEFAKKCITLKGERFEYEINMLIQAVKDDILIKEHVIETIYFNKNKASHFKVIKDAFKIYKVMFQEFIYFSLSGLSSFTLDLIFFKLLYNLLSNKLGIFILMLVSRILSSVYNYNINKYYVFKNDKNKTLIKYYQLFIIQGLISYLFPYFIWKQYNIHPFIIKIGIDFILFLISYQIQQRIVFKKKD